MSAKEMEICLYPEVKRGVSKYLTNDARKSSGLLLAFTPVRFVHLFLKPDFHLWDNIVCVRWSPSGDMIATASFGTIIALLDFKTGKLLYTGDTSDRSILWLFPPITKYLSQIIRDCVLSMLYLVSDEIQRMMDEEKEMNDHFCITKEI